jgi:exosortase D (VPLPA-CTERM-specific)
MTCIQTFKQFRWQLLGIAVLLVALYSRIVPDMVKEWYQDENYSHGFLVPLITAYFLSTRWAELKVTRALPSKIGLLVLTIGLLQLVVAWLGSEYFTMRSSLIVLLVGLVISFFGITVVRKVSFPLAYLLFMVPIPYIIYDAAAFPLKLFVTRVSVATLKLSGISVLREGNIIMFPSTTLEVADACSGIRSLLSLLALAVAFAFFLQMAPWKRWLLICSAVPIAVCTNALRVIVTGFLAQYWGAQAAQGFFHEFAGLVVFGMAMVLLVGLGSLLARKSKCADAELEAVTTNVESESIVPPPEPVLMEESSAGRPAWIPICLMMVIVGLYLNLHQDISVPMNTSFATFPSVVGAWHMTGESYLSDSVQKVLKATDTISRLYASDDGKKVSIYIGYHGGGKESGEIHSPKHCLPGSGWYEVSSTRTRMELNGETLNLVRAVYQNADSKELFLYWFQARNKSLNDEYSLKLAEITNSLLYRRRDASFIRISVPFESDQQIALATGERFIRDFYPTIRKFLPE